MLSALLPPLDWPGRSQKAICETVPRSRPPAESQSSRLVLVGPAMSRSQPASVGLKVSSKSWPSTSRFEALCNWRP